MPRPVTLITGSGRGIGRHLAHYYLHQGHLVAGCSRGETDLMADRYFHFKLDVADEVEVKKLFGWLRREVGHLDNLVNNAGVASMNHSLLTPLATVRRVFDTNLAGTFLFSREGAKLMKKNHYGRIVNLTSVAVPLKLKGEAIYAASKAAVLSLTHVLAQELSEYGITVNAVGPTPIATDLLAGVPKEKIDALVRRQGISRMGTMEDVTNVVDFFLRQESDFITGQCLYLGGV